MKVFKQQGTSHEWIWTESNDGSLSIRAGCFTGTLSELVNRIGTTIAARRYLLIREALQALSRKETVRLVGCGNGDGSNGHSNGYGYGNGNGCGCGGGLGGGDLYAVLRL